ncbi:MAG: glycerophosphodiester phosphodiesterase family protein [Phycisphaera sp.]|nr:MAG: glycerophosphodiester phosphodiesterase family protein [Phycisphaera sp.]
MGDATVLVVAHRAAHRGPGAGGPENSLPSIEAAVAMGCDMVEVDVRRTADGHLVLMHDKTVDRTTNGTGRVDAMTMEQVRELRLLDDDGSPTDLRVPTLREALLACRGRIMVNLDKASGYLAECLSTATRLGMRSHVVLKASVRPEDARGYLASHGLASLAGGQSEDTLSFMPIVAYAGDTSVDDVSHHLSALRVLDAPTIEVCFDGVQAGDRLIDPVAEQLDGRARLWMNSLWDSISGGRSDAQAIDDPHAVWGWMVDHGVSVIQTDEPQRLLEYLRSRGRHW